MSVESPLSEDEKDCLASRIAEWYDTTSYEDDDEIVVWDTEKDGPLLDVTRVELYQSAFTESVSLLAAVPVNEIPKGVVVTEGELVEGIEVLADPESGARVASGFDELSSQHAALEDALFDAACEGLGVSRTELEDTEMIAVFVTSEEVRFVAVFEERSAE